MFIKKEVVAMVLAGGQGSRLYALTQGLAKPGVHYGGKYRIIDFPLSNCVNSGIDTVGVLTQYQPLELNEYIGNGQPWDLDRMHGGVVILQPFQSASGSDWYSGTANAIHQNMRFIERYNPDYVLILSGDHIYKMDYSKMLDFHKEKGADCTISVMEVSMDEASRFGIMNTRDDGLIYEFEEKPKHPKSNLASMGIYIFSTKILKEYLGRDSEIHDSAHDFGKNIIPNLLGDGAGVYAYPFSGYWKDVGTIDSLWEANMDLLDPSVPLDLSDSEWRIYCRSAARPPQFLSRDCDVQNSMITAGCEIFGTVDFSVLFAGAVVEKGALVRDSILMPGSTVCAGAVVEYAIIAPGCTVGPGARVGRRPEDTPDKSKWGIAVVAGGSRIGAGAVIPPKAMIDADIGEGVVVE